MLDYKLVSIMPVKKVNNLSNFSPSQASKEPSTAERHVFLTQIFWSEKNA